MLHLKKISLFCSLVFFFKAQAQFTDQINSNRPGKSMMAYAVGKTIIQAETGLNYINEEHNLMQYKAKGFIGDLALRWGLFKEELELLAEFQYQKDTYTALDNSQSRSAIRQTIFGAKYLIYDPFKNYEEKVNVYSWKANHRFKWRQFIPAVAGYAGINLNFSENITFQNSGIPEEKMSPKAMLIAQNHFGNSWVLVTNLIYNKIGTEYASKDYIITLTKGITKNLSVFAENQGYMGKYYSDGIVRLGAAYLLNNDMQIDGSFGTNIKNTPSLFYGGIGFSWRFKNNYKEIKLAKPGTQSKMDKKMDKALDKKKRKDAVE